MPDMIINEAVVSRLAREVARNIQPINIIREQFKLDIDTFDELVHTPLFQLHLQEELALWHASDPKSIAQRIGAKAATMVEECLVEVYNLVHDKSQPMAAKVEALKWASRMAGVDTNPSVRENGASGDGGVRIVINIGSTKVEYNKTLPAKVIEADVVELTQDAS